MKFSLVLAVSLLSALWLVAENANTAQDERHVIEAANIPSSGAAATDFTPKGWKVEEEISGDLNRNNVPDLVLKLVEDKPAKDADDVAMARYRALVVLLNGADGKFARAAVAPKLLLYTRCGGAFWGGVDTPSEVTIDKGVIIVQHSSGAREMTETTHRFRFDLAVNRFLLIGYDQVYYDRLSGERSDESTNYLTGVRITQKTTYNTKLDKAVIGTPVRKQVSTKKRLIEDVNIEEPEK
jgi:hypothetical protein